MALSLSDIQDLARFHSKDQNLTITSGQGLLIANQAYTTMCLPDGEIPLAGQNAQIGRRWKELNVDDTNTTTVASQESYDLVLRPVFIEEPYVEYVYASSGVNPNYRFRILPVEDEAEWSRLAIYITGIPLKYRYINSANKTQISLRPVPNRAGDTIRIAGYREPVEFVNGQSRTVFINKQNDRALSMIIAAMYKAQRNEVDYAMLLVTGALGLMPKHDYQPKAEAGRIQAWGNEVSYKYRYRGVHT